MLTFACEISNRFLKSSLFLSVFFFASCSLDDSVLPRFSSHICLSRGCHKLLNKMNATFCSILCNVSIFDASQWNMHKMWNQIAKYQEWMNDWIVRMSKKKIKRWKIHTKNERKRETHITSRSGTHNLLNLLWDKLSDYIACWHFNR